MSKSWKYVIVSYITFVIMVLGICGCASMIFHASPLVMRILSNICAWSPTALLFVGWKNWKMDMSRVDFIKKSFFGKLKASLVLISIASTLITFLLGVLIYAGLCEIPLKSVFSLNGYTLAGSVLLSFFSGPTGEECGWRGYLRPQFETKYGFLKGNIITGLVWTFWHTVLWAVDSEFTSGISAVLYILANIIVITSIHMIMAVILEKENNLVYAILVHLFFNLPFSFLNADIRFFMIIMILFLLEAAIFLWIRKKNHGR